MTGINYLDESWNVVSGCSGKGCKARCWVPPLLKRFPAIHGWDEDAPYRYVRGESPVQCAPLPFSTVQFHADRLDQPLHWRKPRRIGVCFTGDLFDEQVPIEWFNKIMGRIIWVKPVHEFYFLTKQPLKMLTQVDTWLRQYYNDKSKSHFKNHLKNIYWGVSVCDQEDWTSKKHDFLNVPGKKWISYEPALKMVQFGLHLYEVDWLILGAESGKNRRPCPIENMVSVVEQCQAAGVKCFVKQIDLNGRVCHDINLFPEALKVRQLP